MDQSRVVIPDPMLKAGEMISSVKATQDFVEDTEVTLRSHALLILSNLWSNSPIDRAQLFI